MKSNAAATDNNVFITSVDLYDFGFISPGHPALTETGAMRAESYAVNLDLNEVPSFHAL